MTEGQKRWARIDGAINTYGLDYVRDPEISVRFIKWLTGLSERTIRRIRNGERGATRKPMGGDRRGNRD